MKRQLSLSNDSSRFDVLWELIFEFIDVDNPQALVYAKEANTIALKKGDSLKIVKSGRISGLILRRLDKLDESIQVLAEVLPISKRHNIERETKFILNALAIAHTFKAEYDKALGYHFQSLVVREKDGDKKQISIALNNIGFVYFRMGNLDLALEYYLKSLEAKKEVDDTFDLDRLLINIGLCYNGLGDYKNAQRHFNQGFEACGGSCDTQLIIEGELGLAKSFFLQGDYSEAEQHHKKSLELSVNEKNYRFQLENLVELTRISLVRNDLEGAMEYLDRTETIPERNQYKQILVEIYQLKADFFTDSKDFEQANAFQRKYSELQDSIFATDVIKNLAKVQTQFAERENLATIASKDQVLELKEEVIDQKTLLNRFLIGAITITFILGFVIFRNYQKIKTVNGALASATKIIEEQNHLLDQQVHVLDEQVKEKTKELVDTNESLVKVNDELDNFIYKTSHDIRGPLASLKGMVNLARMDVKDDKALAYLGKLDVTAEKLNSVLTRLLIVNRINHAELKPEVVHFEPIIQEILTLEMKKGVPVKVKIDYDVASDIQLISDKDMVRLILENLIDNAIKFYNESDRTESFVKITVRSEEGRVTAHVMDNGVGISKMNRENIFQMFVRASERSETGGIGLYLAKLATEKLGGDINLISTDEKYTEFIVQFPQDLHEIMGKRKEEKHRQEQERVWVGVGVKEKSVQSA